MLIKLNNIYCEVHPETDAEREAYAEVCNEFECYAPGYLYTRAYKLWKKSVKQAEAAAKYGEVRKIIGWNGKVNMAEDDGIPTGLLPRLLTQLTGKVDNLHMQDDRSRQDNLVLQQTTVPLRDYQIEAKDKAFGTFLGEVWWPRGVIQMATGGGKTELAAAMIQQANVPTIFIVHTKDLLHQAHKRFKKYGLDVGMVGEGKRDIKPITVSTIQTIWSMHRSDKEDVRWLQQFEQLFFDEAHLVAANLKKGNIFAVVASFLPNANMRWGLTATPFLKDEYSNLLLEAVTGELLYEKRNAALIDEGWLSKPKVTMYKVTSKLGVAKSWPDCYDTGVVLNIERNQKIVELMRDSPKPVLVLVKHIAHGKTLSKQSGAPFVYGGTPTPERLRLANDLISGQLDCVIASTVWDQGIDLPQVRTLILAGGGKSLVQNLQRLGRGLRLCKETGKTEVVVADFFDQTAARLLEHSRKRKGLWKNEGFEVNVETCRLIKNSSS